MTSVPPPARAPFIRRLAGFAGLPLLSAVSPFLVLPLLARFGGIQGWAAIGIGQSVGGLAAVLVLAGWSLHGPALVAGASDVERQELYGDSVIGRFAVLLLIGPAAAIVAVLLAHGGAQPLAALTAVTFALSGLSPAWFCIGLGRPGWIAVYEVVPRLTGVAVSVLLLTASHEVLVYPIVVLASTLSGVLLFSFRVGGLGSRHGLRLRQVLRDLWRDRASVFAVSIAGIYSTTPIAIMSLILPVGALARFSSADRIFRIGLFAIISLGNSLQGWVAEDRPSGVTRRMRNALAAHVVLGLVGGGGIAALAPFASLLLFGPAVSVDPLVALFYGIAYAAISINTSTGGQILIPLGGARGVFWSTAAGAVFGVGGMVTFATLFGGPGGSAGLALGEVIVCCVQLMAIRRRVRTLAAPGAGLGV